MENDTLMQQIITTLDRIEKRQDHMAEIQGTQAVILERNTVSLEEHIKRTNLLEGELRAEEAETKPLKRIYIIAKGILEISAACFAVMEFLKRMGWIHF